MSVSHVTTGGLVHLSGNPIQITLTGSGALDNYKLALRINCAALMGAPFVEEIAPGENMKSVFDISGFVDQPAIYSFVYPFVGGANPHDALATDITFDIGEVWTDAQGERQTSWTTPAANQLKIIKGKLRPYELGILNDSGKSFYSEYIMGGKFLTHQPNFIKVKPNHIPMLWYLSRWTTDHPITTHLLVKTNDGVTNPEIINQHTLWEITGLMEFAVNPVFWGFNQAINTLIESYEFWISDSAGDVSEHRTFLVDNAWYENSFFFYYVNPLSGIDCIWLTGQHTEGIKTESEISYRTIPVLSGSKTASQTVISSSSQRTWEINSGPVNISQARAMRDFLSSKQCWLVDPADETKLIPVNVEPGDNTIFDSKEFIQSLEIKISEAHK